MTNTNGFFTTPGWKKTALESPIDLHSSQPLEELRKLRPILLMGGIHGDEPEGVRLAEETLKWLGESARKGVATAPWLVITSLNADGLAKNQRVNGRGVDLNRNYPSKDWSPKFEKERYYPGPSAASEPEIQAVVSLIEDFKPRLIIHCHSWKPCVVGTGPLAKTDAARLARASGYELVDEIGYPTPGSLSRYGWHDLGIPIICIEENDEITDFDTIWPRFKQGMIEIFTDLSDRKAGAKAR